MADLFSGVDANPASSRHSRLTACGRDSLCRVHEIIGYNDRNKCRSCVRNAPKMEGELKGRERESRAGRGNLPRMAKGPTSLRLRIIPRSDPRNDREGRTTGTLFALLRYRAYSINSWTHALLFLIKPIAGPAARYAITHSTRSARALVSFASIIIGALAIRQRARLPFPARMNVAFRCTNWRAG